MKNERMKDMKKSLVTLVMVFTAMSVFAVDLPKQGFGIQIGWAQPVLRLNSPTSKDTLANTVHLNGFKVGVVYDASYVAGFGSSIGINYTFGMANLGWKSQNLYGMPYPRYRTLITYHQLELYVDWQYKFEVAKETYLILYTGPTIQCGVALSMRNDQKVENPMTGEISTIYGERFDAYNVGDDDQDPTRYAADNALTRLNVTWGVGAGFQYKRYFLRGGYDFGLIKPYKNADFVNGNHTRGRFDQWAIKIGVYLWYPD